MVALWRISPFLTFFIMSDFDFSKIPAIPLNETTHEYEVVPAWTFIGRCISIIDLGTQEDSYQWEIKSVRKISIKFELPTKLDSHWVPFQIYRDLSYSMGEKSNLRKFLQSWRGQAYQNWELDTFNIYQEYLNKPCQITVEQKVSKTSGNTYAVINSISPLMEGITAPERINDLVWFNLESFNPSVYDGFNEKLKEMIAKSPEYKCLAF